MHLTIVGTGYVGLVSGACFADTGNNVIGCDKDADKIARLNRGESPIFEPGLTDLLKANMRAGRLQFTTDLAEGVRHAEVIVIAVGTPPQPDGRPDLSALFTVADEIAAHLDGPKVVVIKSTVPVGTGDQVEARINAKAKHRAVLVSAPEFLKEGSAVEDFQRPDRIVIGAEDAEAADRIRELHEPLVRNQRPILIMRRRAAEMTKYAANAFLAMKISFINQVANICAGWDVDINEVRSGIGTDARIGFQFLYPGVGYGGSCFPKDVQALVHIAREKGVDADLIDTVHQVNQRQRELLFNRIDQRFEGQLKGKCFALWGIAFKPKTDDIREAPAVTLIEKLLARGASVRAHDPEALSNLQQQFKDRVSCHAVAYEALDGADALMILTEWNEFRSPNFDEIRKRLRRPIIFDGRNLYVPEAMRQRGFEYFSIGRSPAIPDSCATGRWPGVSATAWPLPTPTLQARSAPRVRILTYNIYFTPRVAELRDFIREQDPDIVCIQEALIADKARQPADQTDWLNRELGYRCVSSPNWRRYKGAGGIALLTRLDLDSSEVLRDPLGYRFAIAARLRHHGTRFSVVAAHFAWVPRPLPIGIFVSVFRRTAQIRQALSWCRRQRLPCVVAGDFNMLSFGPEYRTIARHLTDCTRAVPMNRRDTRPTWGVPLQLDYAFASPEFRTLGCQVIDVDYSDHRPLVVDLELSTS